ncbi:MAG: DUF192 domain-containing protein [Candidatus Thermoplasmatota archaeon]|nr:DUF192 domain-containing protein [Euryarchaeota archaeon]MBU4032261.1 DUF192 domain-containing protein [Candidatus Thermoplasmatota archaeon]MBU4070631.1 DUF192 domain-containing protein [Candidatus Thermoplasmatota archaeon]MBU4143986.1 DUF192 domain-containing protein [Candidatus Thermoplasmatota archaeon]MBU4592048.1 DUF192 domain-containing protein [Candidatus Thermoplasmatota archaeon]
MALSEQKSRYLVLVLFIIIIIIIAAIWAGRAGQKDEPEALVTFNASTGITFNCEVADTDLERAAGLMYRESLDNGSGMLFVFETPHLLSFWMKNTLIPLDIIFIDENGNVINVEEANPEPGVADNDLTRYKSLEPAKWVLEINQGLSELNHIVPGTDVIIIFNT